MASFLIHSVLIGFTSYGAAATGGVETSSVATPLRQIRIAHLYPDNYYFTPVRYLLRHFDVPERTLLPDFDVIVDGFPFRADAGQAAVELTGILLGSTAYHAVAGPGLQQDTLEIVNLTAKARMLHVHGAYSPSLSDRTRYPYTFRIVGALQVVQRAILYVCSTNEWTRVISIWSEQDAYDSSNGLASQMNIENYPKLARNGDASWAVNAWQASVVQLVRMSRIRVAIIYSSVLTGWQLICRIHNSQVSGMQYFLDEDWTPSWFLASYPESAGDCTVDEMYVAAGGFILLSHLPASPGVDLLGGTAIPPVGGDQSELPLSCMPDVSAHLFYNSGEQLAMAQQDGVTQAGVRDYLAVASTPVDAVCACMLALHDAIYDHGVSLESVEAREEEAFHTVINAMSEVKLQGPTGAKHFNKTGDPLSSYLLLSQLALPDRPNETAMSIAVVTISTHGDKEDVNIMVVNETKYPLMWRDGSTGLGPKPHLGAFPDCSAMHAVLVGDSCEPCPPGTSHDHLLHRCRLCEAGQYQNQSGSMDCETAPPGWYILNSSNPAEIAPCPRGHECPQAGTLMPQPCRQGRFAGNPGQVLCELCPVGKYQNTSQAEDCLSCSALVHGSSTSDSASTSQEQCICPGGTYRPASGNRCMACPKGMTCPEGSDMRNFQQQLALGDDEVANSAVAGSSAPSSSLLAATAVRSQIPQAQRGYMTRLSAPLRVFRCREQGQCPGGPPGTCAALRDPFSVACGRCLSGAYENGDKCEDCGAAKAVRFTSAAVVAALAVVAATLLLAKNVHKATSTSLTIVAVCGLLVTSLQALGVFRSMDLPWEDPVKTLLGWTQVLSFHLDILKVPCVVGINPLNGFALRQSIAVLVVPFIWVTLGLKKYLPRYGRSKTRINVELCNAVGMLYSAFFISISISSMDPFICYRHPDSSGESVQSVPSILCFGGDSDHSTMIIIGIVALCLVPLPFWCVCTYAVIVYPQRIHSRGSGTFLHSMRFLFSRYVPKCFYFLLIVLFRNLCLCLVPVLFRGRPAVQVLISAAILCIYVVVEEELHPWRTPACNALDATLCLLLVTMLLCGALFLEDSPQKRAVAVLSSSILVCLLLAALGVLLFALWRRLLPKSQYHFFICHHKAHAAAQSRLLKSLLQKKRPFLQVFIDSDNLQELDTLFDVVKSRVKHLVAVLTAETLRRPWCAGEIIAAWKSRVPITRLQTPTFVAPTQEQIGYPEGYLDTIGCNLSEYGIQWSDITEAFTAFMRPSVPQVTLSEAVPGTLRFDIAAAALLRQHAGACNVPTLSRVNTKSVVVSTHRESDEANAAGGILVDAIAQDVYRLCEEGLVLLCDYEPDQALTLQAVRHAVVAVVVLSQGCLQSLGQLVVICDLMHMHGPEYRERAPAIISVNTPTFDFPCPAEIDQLCVDFPSLGKSYPNAAEYVKAFFRRISLLIPTHSSQQAIDTHTEQVFLRIQAHVKGKGADRSSGGSLHVLRDYVDDRGAEVVSGDGLTPNPSGGADEVSLRPTGRTSTDCTDATALTAGTAGTSATSRARQDSDDSEDDSDSIWNEEV